MTDEQGKKCGMRLSGNDLVRPKNTIPSTLQAADLPARYQWETILVVLILGGSPLQFPDPGLLRREPLPCPDTIFLTESFYRYHLLWIRCIHPWSIIKSCTAWVHGMRWTVLWLNNTQTIRRLFPRVYNSFYAFDHYNRLFLDFWSLQAVSVVSGDSTFHIWLSRRMELF